jgi:prolyl-tRNA synthetase
VAVVAAQVGSQQTEAQTAKQVHSRSHQLDHQAQPSRHQAVQVVAVVSRQDGAMALVHTTDQVVLVVQTQTVATRQLVTLRLPQVTVLVAAVVVLTASQVATAARAVTLVVQMDLPITSTHGTAGHISPVTSVCHPQVLSW